MTSTAPRRERLVLHRGRERPHVARVQAVRAREARESIGAPDEVRREAGA